MSAIFSVTGPIFALIALGYAVRRGGVFGPSDLRALGRYVVMLALPALIFRAVAGREFGTLVDPAYLAAYLVGSLTTFGLFWTVAVRSGRTGGGPTFEAMGAACANSGFFGYPILLLALPSIADRVLALNMIVENVVLIPLILVLAEASRGGRAWGWTIASVARNPLILALVTGLVLTALRIPVPVLVSQAVEIIARSSAAVSLIVIGGALVDVPRAARSARVLWVAAGKLVAHPLAVGVVFALLWFAGVALDPAMVRAGVLMAAMPVMGVYPVLAAQYGEGAPAAMVMLATTVGGFVTIAGLLLVLGPP
ncbi:MAG: AEC family transporter [Amaricoccus sp.]|uniref:AEC family transporter n=1 Tax=Amaricoccus sp. TaxID=1872485 RepID=UPI0039E7279B